VKLPLSWLRAWVPVPWSDRELAERLTLRGFEIESMSPCAPPFTGVVVAEILKCEPHPQADRLKVCQVTFGGAAPVQIVCGAPNARAGLRSALGLVGAQLPGALKIGAAKLRGVDSFGMLCSAAELQLAAGAAAGGILELPADAPLGQNLRDTLQLDEQLIEVAITPNRGDAMSVLGLARELHAASAVAMAAPPVHVTAPVHDERLEVRLTPGVGGARFVSRVLRGVDNRRAVPAWLRQRLERSGLRAISPIVDVTNYVLLELGQPMHAYDLGRLHPYIEVRRATAGEGLKLLDGRELTLDADVLVIADREGAVGMAGIMGGERSAIAAETSDLLLEVAWFDPGAIAGRARRYGLLTDASQRFERGVDPTLQERALERATELLLAIAGGRPGPAVVQELTAELPRRSALTLRAAQCERLLGMPVDSLALERHLTGLGLDVQAAGERTWRVTAPSWRFDIGIEADLIEELARSQGLDAIPERPPLGARRMGQASELTVDEGAILDCLIARGFSEAVTFGFTDPLLQDKLLGPQGAVTLTNPIAATLSVLRVSLWPGLVGAALENQRRQRERIRLFETATCFERDAQGAVNERRRIAGIALGSRLPEQWGAAREGGDFHDLKGDVAALLALGGGAHSFQFVAPNAAPPCLHPGRSATIERDGRQIGQIGELHPALVRELDLTYAPQLFELDWEAVAHCTPIRCAPVSAFPQIRRDISFTVPLLETFGRIAERVSVAASTRLHELRIFDIYQGKGVESGRKSMALGLILQDLHRTLTDADADEVMGRVGAELRRSLDARIRE